MKTKILLFAILLTNVFLSNAQITLEATYDSAASNLYMVKLEVEGDVYVKVQGGDSAFRFIRFYNLNHSLWKTIDCNSLPVYTFYAGMGSLNPTRFSYNVFYISEHLFDNDDGIEFMYTVSTGTCPQYFTGIYNEDGSPLFTQDSAAIVWVQSPNTAKPIYNTTMGTKMILNFPCSNEAKVYSLLGTLTAANLIPSENENNSLSVYPNPTSESATINYKLPKGEDTGEIVIYDLQGSELKRYSVDNTFSNLILNHNDLENGTYLYSLKVNDKILETKKIIVAH